MKQRDLSSQRDLSWGFKESERVLCGVLVLCDSTLGFLLPTEINSSCHYLSVGQFSQLKYIGSNATRLLVPMWGEGGGWGGNKGMEE